MSLPRTISSQGATTARVRAVTLPTTGIQLVDLALSVVAEKLRVLLAHPRVDQTVIEGVEFTAGTAKEIEHRLGRAYRGCNLVHFRSGGATWFASVQDPSELDEIQVTITASANCVADVEVW